MLLQRAIIAVALAPLSIAPLARASSAPPQETKPEITQTPAEIMASRHPHPARVGSLIGLPVLDWRDSTLGYVEQVVRKPDGRIVLVVPYRQWFGWLQAVRAGRRTIAIPLETVALLGPHVAALDFSRDDFDAAPTWRPEGQAIAPSDTIRIALTKR